MSCKLWGKVTIVSVNINFGAKMSILCKKCEILGEMLTLSLSVHYYWKWLSFCKICLFLKQCVKIWSKKLNFLGYVNLFVLIFIKVFHLLENCYFVSKYNFVQW